MLSALRSHSNSAYGTEHVEKGVVLWFAVSVNVVPPHSGPCGRSAHEGGLHHGAGADSGQQASGSVPAHGRGGQPLQAVPRHWRAQQRPEDPGGRPPHTDQRDQLAAGPPQSRGLRPGRQGEPGGFYKPHSPVTKLF